MENGLVWLLLERNHSMVFEEEHSSVQFGHFLCLSIVLWIGSPLFPSDASANSNPVCTYLLSTHSSGLQTWPLLHMLFYFVFYSNNFEVGLISSVIKTKKKKNLSVGWFSSCLVSHTN